MLMTDANQQVPTLSPNPKAKPCDESDERFRKRKKSKDGEIKVRIGARNAASSAVRNRQRRDA